MSITYKIDTQAKKLYFDMKGEVDAEPIMEVINQILQNPDFDKNYLIFIDMTGSSISINFTLEKIKKLGLFVNSIKESIGKSKWAIFAPELLQRSFAEIFKYTVSTDSIEIEVFSERDKACQYLVNNPDFF